jgi:hypothetical protein
MSFLGPEVIAEKMSNSTIVAIVYGEPIIGQAVARQLQTTDYQVRLVSEASLKDPVDILTQLDDCQLLLFTPSLSTSQRNIILRTLESAPSTAELPVLELGTPLERTRPGIDYSMSWPSRTEELRRSIEVILLSRENDREDPGEIREEQGNGHI